MLLAEPEDKSRQIGSHQITLIDRMLYNWKLQWQVASGLPSMKLGSPQKGGIE